MSAATADLKTAGDAVCVAIASPVPPMETCASRRTTLGGQHLQSANPMPPTYDISTTVTIPADSIAADCIATDYIAAANRIAADHIATNLVAASSIAASSIAADLIAAMSTAE
jgi:hypothetical protein